jgi:hypothetical protein
MGTLEFLTVFAYAKLFNPCGGSLTADIGISSIIKSAYSK